MHAAIPVREDLVLELISDQHAGSLFDLVDQNRAHLSTWLPWVSGMQTVDDFGNYIRHCKRLHDAGTDYGYVISQNGIVVGRIGLHYVHPQNRSAAIGYWLGKEHEGKGIISAACIALINFGFHQLQLNRIEIKCGTANDRSAAIPERLGFTKEGVLRQAEWVNTHFIDLSLYSMLREEWQQRNHR